jgi:hypothetical protein
MAVTAHFDHKDEVATGRRWSDDYGRTICTWTYDPASREIEVRYGSRGSRKALPASDLTAAELKTRLAIEMAELINGERYDF